MGIFSELFKKDVSENESVPVKKENIPALIDASLVNVSVSVQHNEPEIPPLQGNYAKAVFLWAFSKPSPIRKSDEYAAYFLYECGIRDCVKYHQNMINEGYLIEAELCEALNVFKIPELKEMLKELDQPISGKKAVLIDRILENTDDDFLRTYCTQKLYKASTKGIIFLEVHAAYVQLHKHKNWGVSWEKYDRYARPDQDFLSTMWIIFNEQLENADLLESRYLYYQLYSVLLEQGKRSDALEMLLKVFYLDLSGVELQSLLNLYHQNIYTKKS